MESPEGWDLLISSLAVCDLQKPAAVWAFLALQGLVRDLPSDRIAFFKIVHKVRTSPPSTNSSRARRIARRLRLKGIALPTGDTPDPKGDIALHRRQLMDIWTKSFTHCEQPSSGNYFALPDVDVVQKMYTLCSSCYNVYELSEKHSCPEIPKVEQPTQSSRTNHCSHCHTDNRIDAQFCRGCGNQFFVQAPLKDQVRPHYKTHASSSIHQPDGCFFDVLNVIRDVKATKGLSKKTHKK